MNSEYEKSLKQIDLVYDRNRTQMFKMLTELEFLAVHELKNARQKLNFKHLGNITHLEREMEDVCDQFSKSGRISVQGHGINQLEKGDGETPRAMINQPQIISARSKSQYNHQRPILNGNDIGSKAILD